MSEKQTFSSPSALEEEFFEAVQAAANEGDSPVFTLDQALNRMSRPGPHALDEYIAEIDAIADKLYRRNQLGVPGHRWYWEPIETIAGHTLSLWKAGCISFDPSTHNWSAPGVFFSHWGAHRRSRMGRMILGILRFTRLLDRLWLGVTKAIGRLLGRGPGGPSRPI